MVETEDSTAIIIAVVDRGSGGGGGDENEDDGDDDLADDDDDGGGRGGLNGKMTNPSIQGLFLRKHLLFLTMTSPWGSCLHGGIG